MKPALPYYLLVSLAAACVVGCDNRSPEADRAELDVVAEGVIWSVEYKFEDGGTGGFTRMNNVKCVPGGNGTWNVDAYGKLTKDFLIISRPQRKELGVRVIPVGRIVDIQFGDGGIKHVDENNPAPAS